MSAVKSTAAKLCRMESGSGPSVAVIVGHKRNAVALENDGLRFEGDAEARGYGVADPTRERPDLCAGGMAVIDEHQRVLVGDARVAVADALEAAGLDEPGGGDLGLALAAVIGRQFRIGEQQG